MIGIIAYEGATVVEVKPLFAEQLGFSFKVPNCTTDDQMKEWGFAFSNWTTLWVMCGDMTYNYNLKSLFSKWFK